MTKTPKAENTRATILEAALDLFLEHGYQKTTMRAVAKKAGVSVGNAYYYFESKEELIQGFYDLAHRQHVEALEPLLQKETKLERRLHLLLRIKIETIAPYHEFSGALFKTASDPKSPLNPFSAQSQPVRDEAIALLERVIDGSEEKIHKDLRGDLPRLLWLYEMGIILFWLHDTSEGCARTLRLIDRSVEMVVKLIRVSGLPLLGSLRKAIPDLLEELVDADIEDLGGETKKERPPRRP